MDTNYDLWNDKYGIEYALVGKKEHKPFRQIGDEIFDNITSENSDFIIDYKNDTRRWEENATADNIVEILKKKYDELEFTTINRNRNKKEW